MLKIIKKVTLSLLSILGINLLLWTIFLLNPNLSYADKTSFDHVTVFHNQNLDKQTKTVIKNAMEIIENSALFNDKIKIQLCLSDDKIYPNLHPFSGQPLAYAMFNKTILKNCEVKFNENLAEANSEINNNQLRKYNLTWLLAHEFTHNLQYNTNSSYVIRNTLGKLNWKLEGHAEYIAREYKNDGKLLSKIKLYLIEENKEHVGIPVFEIEDGTKQSLLYFKYALVMQYLMEEKKMNFQEVCELEEDFDKSYKEMIEWSND